MSKKIYISLVEKYGKDYFSRIAKKSKGIKKRSGFGSDKVGADGLTGRERASKCGRLKYNKG